MSSLKKSVPYTKEELTMALPAYGFVVVYLLALIPNDVRLIGSSPLLAVIISGRVFVGLVFVGVVGTVFIPRLRRWYIPLNNTAFLVTALLQPPILYARPEIFSYSLLPTLIIMAVMFFVIPGPFNLKIFIASLLTASDLAQMFFRGNMPVCEEWTFTISYLGMVVVGSLHEIRLHKLRRYRKAYQQWVADEVRFKSVLANSSFQGIFLVEEGRVKDLNQMMAELIGREPEDIKGVSVSRFYRLEEVESVLIPGVTQEGWIQGVEDQETPVRLTLRDVALDEVIYQALLVEDRTQEQLGTKEEKAYLSSVALDTKNLPLTKRQRQIVAGLLNGCTRQKLAEELYISEDTVKSHISHIYRKLKVRSRIELARRVLGE